MHLGQSHHRQLSGHPVSAHQGNKNSKLGDVLDTSSCNNVWMHRKELIDRMTDT